MKLLRGWAAFMIIGSVAIAQPRGQTKPSSTVTIHVIDENGITVDGCQVENFVDRDHEMSSHFRGLQGTQIRYGVYKYALKRGRSGSAVDLIQGVVSVWEQEKLVVVSTSRSFMAGVIIDSAIPPGFVIRGRLDPPPARPHAEPVWIRLSPIHGTEQLDVSVDVSGEFSIYSPLAGRYLLTVIREDQILQVQQVSFEENWRPAELIVKMPQEPPPSLHVQARTNK